MGIFFPVKDFVIFVALNWWKMHTGCIIYVIENDGSLWNFWVIFFCHKQVVMPSIGTKNLFCIFIHHNQNTHLSKNFHMGH